MRAVFLKTLRTGLAISLVALLAQPMAAASTKETRVTISNFTFGPQTTTVTRGEAVRFVNSDDMVHTIVAADGSFRSGPLDTGDSFVRTFGKPGTIAYYCGLHPFMKGTIVVK